MTSSDAATSRLRFLNKPASAAAFFWKRLERQDDDPKRPALLEFRSSTLFIVFTICLAIFTDILFYGLIVPVIPFSLTAQVGVPEDEVQHWTAILLACYNAALFVGSPVAGFYADHSSSRRWPLLLGLVALCSSTLLLCLGRTVALLALGRVLQGLSAAIVWSVGLALLVDTVGKDIGYAMGYVNIAMSVGLLIAPVIGGAVYAAAGYYAVYYIAFAVIVCDIALRLILVEKKVARQWLDDGNRGVTGIDGAGAPQDQPEAGALPSGPTRAGTQGDRAGDGPAASCSPSRAGSTSGPPESSPSLAAAATHPHRELFKSRRVLAVLLCVVLEAVVV